MTNFDWCPKCGNYGHSCDCYIDYTANIVSNDIDVIYVYEGNGYFKPSTKKIEAIKTIKSQPFF